MTREEICIKFLATAIKELGVHETSGSVATARIVEYDSYTTLHATSDEVAWCSAFANFITANCGFPGTKSAAARSWLTWGLAVPNPLAGCIVVLDRHDDSNPNAAHVTFYEKDDENGNMVCIGGNQSDMVKRSVFSYGKVLGFRVPA